MPNEWKILSVAESPIEIVDGDRGTNYPKQNEFAFVGDCLFLNAGNVTTTGFDFKSCTFITKEKDAVLRKGKLLRQDVVLTTRGTIGNVAFFDDPVPFENIRINSGMVLLRANQSELLPRFLYLLVKSQLFQDQIAFLTTGSAQPQLPIRDLRRVKLPIPPLEDQYAITCVLGALDDKIEQNQRTMQALKRLSRSIFRAWFVDFEPVKAKATGASSFPSMPQLIFDNLPCRFTKSKIGNIPEGWKAGSFGSLLEESMTKIRDEKLGLVLSAVSSGELVASDDHFIKRVYSKSLNNYKVVPPGAISFNPSRINIGSIGVNHREINGVVSPVYVVCSAPREYEWFFEFYLRLPNVRKQFETLSSGSVRQSLRSIDFLSIELAVPNRDLVLEFNKVFLEFKNVLDALDCESKKLADLRDYLLPKLLNGSIRVEVPNA